MFRDALTLPQNRLFQRRDAGGGAHATVTNHDHVIDPFKDLDFGGNTDESCRIRRVAGEDRHSDRDPGPVGQNPLFILLHAAPFVP